MTEVHYITAQYTFDTECPTGVATEVDTVRGATRTNLNGGSVFTRTFHAAQEVSDQFYCSDLESLIRQA
jgi:hypothetical protein